MLMGILVVGVGAVVYGDTSSGNTLPQTASHTLAVTVDAAYYIAVSATTGITTLSPLVTPVEDTAATLTYKINDIDPVAKITVDATALSVAAAWLNLTVVATDPTEGSAAAAVTIVTGGSFAAAAADLITTIDGEGEWSAGLTYSASMTDWGTASESTTTVTVQYVLTTG